MKMVTGGGVADPETDRSAQKEGRNGFRSKRRANLIKRDLEMPSFIAKMLAGLKHYLINLFPEKYQIKLLTGTYYTVAGYG